MQTNAKFHEWNENNRLLPIADCNQRKNENIHTKQQKHPIKYYMYCNLYLKTKENWKWCKKKYTKKNLFEQQKSAFLFTEFQIWQMFQSHISRVIYVERSSSSDKVVLDHW